MSDSHYLDGIHTVWDAQEKLWSIHLVDAALIWHQGSFVSLHPKMLRRTVKDILVWISKPRESDIIESLCDHVCSSCEYALRTPKWIHHLFRYLPMTFTSEWRGAWDGSKEVIHTICTKGIWLSSIPQLFDPSKSDYAHATLHVAPMESCPKKSFLLQKK